MPDNEQPSEKAMKEAERFCHEASESGKHHESGVCHSYVATILDRFAEAARREENDLAIEALERLLLRAANGDISSGDVRAERDAIAARRRP
jgi:hypothetical protein